MTAAQSRTASSADASSASSLSAMTMSSTVCYTSCTPDDTPLQAIRYFPASTPRMDVDSADDIMARGSRRDKQDEERKRQAQGHSHVKLKYSESFDAYEDDIEEDGNQLHPHRQQQQQQQQNSSDSFLSVGTGMSSGRLQVRCDTCFQSGIARYGASNSVDWQQQQEKKKKKEPKDFATSAPSFQLWRYEAPDSHTNSFEGKVSTSLRCGRKEGASVGVCRWNDGSKHGAWQRSDDGNNDAINSWGEKTSLILKSQKKSCVAPTFPTVRSAKMEPCSLHGVCREWGEEQQQQHSLFSSHTGNDEFETSHVDSVKGRWLRWKRKLKFFAGEGVQTDSMALAESTRKTTKMREAVGIRYLLGDHTRRMGDMLRLFFYPGAIDLEERDVRRWICSVNRTRRHGVLLPELQGTDAGAQFQEFTEPKTTYMSGEATEGNSGVVSSPPAMAAVAETKRGHMENASVSRTAADMYTPQKEVESSSLDPARVPGRFLEDRKKLDAYWTTRAESGSSNSDNSDDQMSGMKRHSRHWSNDWRKYSMEAYALEVCPMTPCGSVQQNIDKCPGTSENRNYDNGSVLAPSSLTNNYKRDEEKAPGMRCLRGGNDGDYYSKDYDYQKEKQQGKSMSSDKRPAMDGASAWERGIMGDDGRGIGSDDRDTYVNHHDRVKVSITSLKSHFVIMATFMPLALFIGLSVLTSAIVISGLLVVVVALLLGVLVYRHIVALYSLCFSQNLWPTIPLGCNRRHNNERRRSLGASPDGSWLLMSPSLLELTHRFGGRWMYLLTKLLYMGALLAAAILFMSFGFTLTGGAVGIIRTLWDHSAFETLSITDSLQGCQLGPKPRFLALFPFLALAVCFAGPTAARSRFCWWETGIFRLVSLTVFGLLFFTMLTVQLVWTLKHSPSVFDIPLRFIVDHAWGRRVPSLQWLQDTVSQAEFWTEWQVLAYMVWNLSLSVALLSWFFGFGLSAIKAGTYHLYLMPFLWRRGTVWKERPQGGEEDDERRQHSAKRFDQGVFAASGFGTPFCVAFVLFMTLALVSTFLAFVGTTMSLPALAAPSPLRLLWTAVPVNLTDTDAGSKRKMLCALGILESSPVGVLRFTAVLSFIAGIMLFAWVPYCVLHASSMLAYLNPVTEPEERQELAAMAFLRSKQAAARRRAGESHSLNLVSSTTHPTTLRSRFTHFWYRNKSQGARDVGYCDNRERNEHCGGASASSTSSATASAAAAAAVNGSVIFNLSSPFMLYPEQYHATTRAGDGVRVLELFKHLRLITLEENWFSYHISEVLLLRLPFLVFVFMVTSLLVAGRFARCYEFWAFWETDLDSASSSHKSNVMYVPPFCKEAASVPISDQLYGRLVLFAALSGGFLMAPLVFAVPAFILLRCWWERWRCMRMPASLAQLMQVDVRHVRDVAPKQPHDTVASPTLPLLWDGEKEAEVIRSETTEVSPVPLEVPVGMNKRTTLAPSAALGGLAGVQFFIATQKSIEGPNAWNTDCNGTRKTAGVASTTRRIRRHRHPMYNAPLVPSQYYQALKQREEANNTPSTIAHTCCSGLQCLVQVLLEAFPLLVALTAWVGAWRAVVALAYQYGIWTN
ncbi:hypothetical protein MOQ_005721 [Trypanosoma cruzi marinkellei]|uniref:Transmembrane protein n=1 Tax=Trypanosoma cruzi marinkellei TaxID=85056 RepID=K2MXE6_TRYCR|nr:hypothetical protein MOQ_005721 [Trypanosoma cruzi marinkellei]